ncbi:hypothetical protein U0070_017217 [Myodes glareolus]|uniref:Secreted protein n=1 Tax=Myodes glareolus TaxID=447135 RepID=A0AAW0HWU9_MYOGA
MDRQMKTESMLMPGLIIASCFFTSVEGASEDCIAGAVARQLLLPGQPQDTPFLTCSLLLRVQQHILHGGPGEDSTSGTLNQWDGMEGNLTGTSSGVICTLYVVVNYQSMH